MVVVVVVVGVGDGQGTLSNVVLKIKSKQPTDGLLFKTMTHSDEVPIGSMLSISK